MNLHMCSYLYLIASSNHQILSKPPARGQGWYLDLVVLILSALCLLDLLERFTTRHAADSHFQGHKKTELVMIHPLSHSKQTGRRFHCLFNSDAMSYSLQAYCSLWSVSLFSFFFPTLEGNVHLIWTGIGINVFFRSWLSCVLVCCGVARL